MQHMTTAGGKMAEFASPQPATWPAVKEERPDSRSSATSLGSRQSYSSAQSGDHDRKRKCFHQGKRFSGGPDPETQLDELCIDPTQVTLDLYNSDLNLKIDSDGYGAESITEPPGFCFCWGGARAAYGVSRGKVCFEVYIADNMRASFGDDHEEADPHVARVGWSRNSTSFQLGEEPYSYGYGGTGRFSTNSKFSLYGERFEKGDVITACVDFELMPPQIIYCKNGKWLGPALKLHGYPVGRPEAALFPHILCKNIRLEINFGQRAPFCGPPHGYTFIDHVPMNQRIRGAQEPPSKAHCEMIMIVGLPGAGKTTWGIRMREDHPDKQYNIIGTDTLIDKMKVMGLPRKRNYHGRWDVLIGKATKCLNKLFQIGSRRRRNYILDQTNVYASARKRKLRSFQGFHKKLAVLVTTDEVLQQRSEKRTREGKYVPETAVLEMKANFVLPQQGEPFVDDIMWIELRPNEAAPLIQRYNQDGQANRPSRDVAFPHDSRRQQANRPSRDVASPHNSRRQGNRPSRDVAFPNDSRRQANRPSHDVAFPHDSRRQPPAPSPTSSASSYDSGPPEKRQRTDSKNFLAFLQQQYAEPARNLGDKAIKQEIAWDQQSQLQFAGNQNSFEGRNAGNQYSGQQTQGQLSSQNASRYYGQPSQIAYAQGQGQSSVKQEPAWDGYGQASPTTAAYGSQGAAPTTYGGATYQSQTTSQSTYGQSTTTSSSGGDQDRYGDRVRGSSRYGDRGEVGRGDGPGVWERQSDTRDSDRGCSSFGDRRGGDDRYGGRNRHGDRDGDQYSDRGSDHHGDRGGDRYGDRGDHYSDRGSDRYGDRGSERYGDRGGDRYRVDRYSDRGSDRYGDKGGDSYGDRGGDRYGDRGGNRYGDRDGDRHGDRGGDRYGVRGTEGYGDSGSDGYCDRDADRYGNKGSDECGDRDGDRYGNRGSDLYGERGGDPYGNRGADRYGDRDGDRYGNRGSDHYGDRGGDGNGDQGDRYGDKGACLVQ